MAALLFFLRFGRLPHASPLRQGANRFPKAWNTVTYHPTGEPCPKDAGDEVGHCISGEVLRSGCPNLPWAGLLDTQR